MDRILLWVVLVWEFCERRNCYTKGEKTEMSGFLECLVVKSGFECCLGRLKLWLFS